MVTALIISNLVLWLAVLALAAIVLALLRQVGVLHERVAPAGALMTGSGPRVGEAAPVVTAADWDGETRTVGGADADGRETLLFFLSPTCPVCRTLLPVLDSVSRAEGRLRVLLASDGPRAEHEAFVREHGLAEHGYLLSTELGLAYGVSQLPHAALIDADGVLRARGLVNTREHLDSLFEARDRGLASVQEYLEKERVA